MIGTASALGTILRDEQAPALANVVAYVWKSHTVLDAVTIQTGSATQQTDSNGTTGISGIVDPISTIQASRAIPVAESALTDQAVNLQDAIAILKMIVGLDVNGAGKPLSPYQALAADFDGNGQVNLNDAIGVLKHVVGLPAPLPQWIFFNEADSTMASRANLNPGVVTNAVALPLNAEVVHLGLVGVLRGDVDGSFGGIPNAPGLDSTQPTYFVDHGLPLAQFGIYPPP